MSGYRQFTDPGLSSGAATGLQEGLWLISSVVDSKLMSDNAPGLSKGFGSSCWLVVWVTVYLTPQLIRGGLDSIINLIFRLFFSKRRPAITLEDPSIKYALRLIDKQVTASTHDPHMSRAPKSSSCVHWPLHCRISQRFLNDTLFLVHVSDRQSWHQKVPICSAVPWTRPGPPHRFVSTLALLFVLILTLL